MKRIDTPTALAGGHFSNANPDAGGLPTQLDASWFENVQEELAHVVEESGRTLDGGNKTQLLAAIRETIWAKPREHHFNDSSMPATRGMYRIGG